MKLKVWKPGEVHPMFGIGLVEYGRGCGPRFLEQPQIAIRFLIGITYRRSYEVYTDEFRTGWWLKHVQINLARVICGRSVVMRSGLIPIWRRFDRTLANPLIG